MLVSQLNRTYEATWRASDTDVEPYPLDLYGTSEVEKSADKLIFLHHAKKKDDDGQIVLEKTHRMIVRLNRNGPTGECEVYFRKPTSRFLNAQEAEEATKETPF